jgi:hypothetical protein
VIYTVFVPLKKRTAQSIGEVMGIVSEARREWRLPIEDELWFRGEDARHLASTLQPKLYRHLPASVTLVSKDILRKERFLHDEFARCGTQLHDHEMVDEWDWYFLMQHHGAPTRLLDWSDGYLMAAHFAVSGDISNSKGGFIYLIDPFRLVDDIDDLAATKDFRKLWKDYREARQMRQKSWPKRWGTAYIPGRHSLSNRTSKSPSTEPCRPDLPDAPLVLEFPQITRRVAAQRSRFMAYGRNKRWLTEWAKADGSRIWRIFIPKRCFPAIKKQLRDAGMTESVIFPDLDGLGRELDQLWNSLKMRFALSK